MIRTYHECRSYVLKTKTGTEFQSAQRAQITDSSFVHFFVHFKISFGYL